MSFDAFRRDSTSSQRLSAALAALLTGALAGCNGGGGAAPSASAPTTITYKTPGTTFSAFSGSFSSEGLASRVAASGTVDSSGNFTTVDKVNVTLPTGRTTFLTTAGSNTVTVSSLPTGAMTNASGSLTSNGTDQYRGGASGSNQNDFISYKTALDSSLGTTTLSYAYVGEGSIGTLSQNGQTVAFDGYMFNVFGGQKTQTADMPTTGTADYEGGFKGKSVVVAGNGPSSAELDGRALLKADFGAKTFKGTIDNLREYPANDPNDKSAMTPTIDLNGTISTNQFGGSAAFANLPVANVQQSGVFEGGFFGPKATEAAGALAVKAVYTPTGASSNT
ncbi:MAG TPA: transferrin-binding protein-like solute binding protein, partial [Beijerinckiaceae bacterium]